MWFKVTVRDGNRSERPAMTGCPWLNTLFSSYDDCIKKTLAWVTSSMLKFNNGMMSQFSLLELMLMPDYSRQTITTCLCQLCETTFHVWTEKQECAICSMCYENLLKRQLLVNSLIYWLICSISSSSECYSLHWLIYTVVHKKCHFYFYHNFGKCGLISIIFSVLDS